MKKFLMIALLAMAGITAASDSKTDVGTEITLDEARSLLSGGSSAPGSTVIRLSPIDFKDNKQDIASISISMKDLEKACKTFNMYILLGIGLLQLKESS